MELFTALFITFRHDHDAGITKLVAPENSPDNYSWAEPLIIRVKNFGLQNINEDFTVSYTLEGLLQETFTIPAGTTPLLSNQTIDVEFTPVNMNTSGSYHFKFFTSCPAMRTLNNDTLTKTLVSNVECGWQHYQFYRRYMHCTYYMRQHQSEGDLLQG